MCILRKRLPYSQKTKDKLAKLPKIYLVACWAHYGVREFPFSGKYKKGIPLVYDFDDHNGTYPEYVLRPITWTTTGTIVSWVRDEQQAKETAESYEKRLLKREQELQRKYEERIKKFGSEENYLMAIFGKKKESDTDQAGSDILISPAENDEK